MIETSKLKGSYATIFTPFIDADTIDEPELRKEIEFLCSTGITGLFPLASTSEFPYLSCAAKEQYLSAVAQTNRGRKLLLAGCCGVNYGESMRLLSFAGKYGYDAAIICPPYYFTHTGDELYRYYKKLADNPYGVKLIMYNIPAFTSEIPVSVAARLMTEPNIIGIKDSSGNMRRISALANQRELSGHADFLIFCGNDDIVLPAMVAGADGCVSAMTCLAPEVVTMLLCAYNSGNMPLASDIQSSYVELVRLAETLPFPAGYKLIAKARGMNTGYEHTLCEPEALDEARAKIRGVLESVLRSYGDQNAVL